MQTESSKSTEVGTSKAVKAKAKTPKKAVEATTIVRKGGKAGVANAMADLQFAASQHAPESHSEAYELTQDRLFALSSQDNHIVEVPISQLIDDENVRKNIDTTSPSMLELAESIRTHGMLQHPVISVIKNPETGDYSISLLVGKRRVAAQSMLGQRYVRCLHRVVESPLDRHIISFIENKHRSDISTLDTALAYKTLRDDYSVTKSKLAKLCLLDRDALRKYLNIASWPTAAHSYVRSNEKHLTFRALFAIASKAHAETEILGLLKASVKQHMDEELVKQQRKNKRAAATGKPLPFPHAGLPPEAAPQAADAATKAPAKVKFRRIMGASQIADLQHDLEGYFKEEEIPEAARVYVRRALAALNLLPGAEL